MFKLLNISKPADVVDARVYFDLCDVVQLYKTSHPGYSHVLFTNTWHAKYHPFDVSIPSINLASAELMLSWCENTCVDMHEDDIFYDDELFELGYKEFHSQFEGGKLYGYDKEGYRCNYYNPMDSKLPAYPFLDKDAGLAETKKPKVRILKKDNRPKPKRYYEPSFLNTVV